MRLIDADKLRPTLFINIWAIPLTTIAYAPTIDAINIPKNATNGDVIRAVFPNWSIFYPEDIDNTVGINVEDDEHQLIDFSMEWWNAPYKKEVEE